MVVVEAVEEGGAEEGGEEGGATAEMFQGSAFCFHSRVMQETYLFGFCTRKRQKLIGDASS